MSKIDNDAARAFVTRQTMSRSNTQVTQDQLLLHGHAIARRTPPPAHNGAASAIVLNLCGWGTATTRARLNAVLNELGLMRIGIVQRDHGQHVQIRRIDGTTALHSISSHDDVVIELDGQDQPLNFTSVRIGAAYYS